MNEMSEKIPEGSLKTEPDQNLINELFSEEEEQFDKGLYREAEATLKKILELDEGNVQALNYMGRVCIKLGKNEEALEWHKLLFEILSEDSPLYKEVLRSKGIALSQLGRDSEALGYFDKSIRLDPEYAKAHCSKGISLSKLGRDDEAIKCFDISIYFDPGYMKAYKSKGISLSRLRRDEEAIKCFDEILSRDSNNKEAYKSKGISLSRLRRDEEAIKCFDEILSRDSNNKEAYKSKGISLSRLRRDDEAIKCFDEILSRDSNNKEAYKSRGISLSKLGNEDAAIKCFDKAIQIDPFYTDAYNSRGISYSKLGEEDSAIECFDKALQIDPNYKDAYNSKGISLSKKGKEKDAIKCFDKIIGIDPDNVWAYNSKGISFNKLGRYIKAIECFDKIIGIDPDNVWAYIYKGISAKNLKYYGLSHQALKKAEDRSRKDSQKYQIYIETGNVLIERQNYADAIHDFKKALEIRNDDPRGLVRMGVSFSRLGDDGEAIKCFDEALRITGDEIEKTPPLDDVKSKKEVDNVKYYLDSWNCKGFSYSKLSREDDALKCFEVVIGCFTENSGKELQKKDDEKDPAIKVKNYFEKNSEIKKTLQGRKLSALNNKGRALFNQKKYTEALKCFEKAADQEKKYWKAFYSKGLLLMEWENCPDKNRYQNALESFDIAISIDPSNAELHAQKGNALMMLDRFEEADNSFNTALRIDKSCASAYTGLGSSKARKELMIEELKCQKKLLEGITDAVEGTQKNLSELSKKMESDLKKVSSLIYVQFILGIVLFGLAIALPLFGFENTVIRVVSALGGTAFIINSVTLSPSKIQKNRIDYSQWLIAYYNWIHTHHGLSSYLLGEIKKSQIQADPLNAGTSDDWQKIEKLYKYLNEVSITTIQQMELFCEFPLKNKNNDAYIELLKGVRPQEEETTGDNAENPEKSPDPSSSAGKK